MTRGGLPHSDIPGSKLVCSSPRLFAACHVLHRLLAPRHSPYTLSSLTIRNSKLTLTNRLHVNWSATVPMQHCVCLWSEKTTVCRIFSCQRSDGGSAPGLGRSRGPKPHSALAELARTRRASVTSVGAPLGSRRACAQRSHDRRRRRCARDSRASLAHRNFSKISNAQPCGWLVHRRSQACQRAKVGGEYRARTGDLLVANQALSQLS